MNLKNKILFILVCSFYFLSCSSGFHRYLINYSIKDLKNKGFVHPSGSYSNDNQFYNQGGTLGELPLIIDFKTIELNKKTNQIKLIGFIKDFQTGEPISSEIIFANITNQDSFLVSYSPRLKVQVDSTGFFDIVTQYKSNEIMITKSLSYFITYYDLSKLY